MGSHLSLRKGAALFHLSKRYSHGTKVKPHGKEHKILRKVDSSNAHVARTAIWNTQDYQKLPRGKHRFSEKLTVDMPTTITSSCPLCVSFKLKQNF